LFLEAKKLCFQDRSVYYADTDASRSAVQELISKEYARKRAGLINTRKAAAISEPGRIRNSSNTVYLSVADTQGNMVSLIQSLYSPWGSHCVVDELGFALQNRGALFSLNEQAWNRLEPHKRPLHTIIPSFITREGRPQFSFGVTGGDFQPQGQVQVLMNIIDHHMSVRQAGDSCGSGTGKGLRIRMKRLQTMATSLQNLDSRKRYNSSSRIWDMHSAMPPGGLADTRVSGGWKIPGVI
jgi:gamma-glutamyltranspeptidase/glutathione hydrolase